MPDTPAPPPPPILVLGTTASGKSDLAMALAQSLPRGGECVSADSMQIYRGLDIGTAKPSLQERAAIPHHMIDVADPHDLDRDFTVADWLEGAEPSIAAIEARGRHPIVVGGTHLYLQALLHGLFEGPAIDAALRASLESLPAEALREELERVDPAAAARIHRADRRRTLRAVEVHRQTGTPLSTLQTQWGREHTAVADRSILLIVERPTPIANGRINRRTGAMLGAGWLDEVESLLATGPLHRQAAEAVGYRELADVLRGGVDLETAAEAIKVRTRRYAKQQRTWLKRFRVRPRAIRIEAGERELRHGFDPILDEALARIGTMLEAR